MTAVRNHVDGGLLLFAVAILGYSVFLVAVVEPAFGMPIVVRGSYPLVGLVVGYALLRQPVCGEPSGEVGRRFSPSQLEKVSFVAALLYLSLLLILDVRWILLLVVLPVVVYAALQSIIAEHSARALRLVIVAFALPPVTKILENGYYFGSVDILKEIPETTAFLQSGSATALPGWYRFFPVSYLATGSTTLVADIGTYASSNIVSILFFSLLPVTVYYTLFEYVDRRTALSGAFGFLLVSPPAYFATQFYPTSLVMIYFAFLVLALPRLSRGSRRWKVLAIVFLTAITVTHHLSVLFLLGILALVYAVERAGAHYSGDRRLDVSYVASFLILFSSTYWLYTSGGSRFVRRLSEILATLVARLLLGAEPTNESPGKLYVSGIEVFRGGDTASVADSLVWMLTPDGIVNTLYVSLIVVSLVAIYRERPTDRVWTVLAVPGFVCFVFVLKSPFVVPGLFRARLFFSFVGLFFVVFGVRHAIDQAGRKGAVSVPLVLLLVFAVSMPLSVADDVNELRPDADKTLEKSYTQRELVEMDSAGAFATDRMTDEFVTAFYTRVYLASRTPGLQVGSVLDLVDGECGGTYLLYRHSWSDHVVVTVEGRDEGRGHQYVTSDRRLEGMTRNSDKVYTNGGAGFVQVGNCGTRDVGGTVD